MKKTKLCFCGILLAAVLSLGAAAAETVIYENDFSDPATLADFKQYRMEWEIRDGGLYLTDRRDDKVEKVTDAFSHIIYQAKEPLTDYVVEVDYRNVQTSGGIVFNVQQEDVTTSTNGFRGYLAFVTNAANKMAFGCVSKDDKWKGSLGSGGDGNVSIGSNVHIKVTVKGKDVHFLTTDLDTGKTVYELKYTIGTNKSVDAVFEGGTVGFRMRGGYTPNNVLSVGTAYFDNFRITTVPEEPKPATTTEAPLVHAPADPIDTSSLVEIYRNGFDSADALADFTQYRGKWNTFAGRLYLSSMDSTSYGQSFLLYSGDKALTELTDYVIDVDVYNTQTQGGLAGRVDLPSVTGKSDDGIYGYVGYISFAGTAPVLGYGKANGTWGGNFGSASGTLTPGMDIHLQMAFKGDVVQLTVTELATGNLIWTRAESVELWEKGTFGFRVYGKMRGDLDNINNTAYDNLVISTFGEPVAKTEVKLQIDSLTGYVNGEAKELDAAPVIRNDRTMLPVRFVAENLGGTVGWDGATRTVTVSTATTTLEIKIDSDVAKVNGTEITLDSPAFIENDRTYLPVRFVAEKLGATVEWDGITRTATLIK